jgi:heat shock protein HslJ
MTPVPDDVMVTLILDGDQAGGSGGCNSYFASYTIDNMGSALTFADVGATMMFCEGAAGEVEAAYLANLANVATWANTGGSLVLGDASGEPILTYVPAPTEALPSIEGITWLLTSQAVEGQLAPVASSADTPVVVSLRLEDSRAGGNAGCNNYFAEFALEDTSLTFGPIGATQMFCEGAPGEVETAYLANLAAVASWSSDGSTLSLSDASGSVILEYAAGAEASIVGGWVATGINNGAEAVVATDTTGMVTAVFGEDGSLTGFDGCNDYFTSYTLDGAAIAISPEIGSTRMACASDALSEQSQQYLTALVAATTWAVGPDGSLELRDDSGALQVSYAAAVG